MQNTTGRKVDSLFKGETEAWLDKYQLEVMACLLQDVNDYRLPENLVTELVVRCFDASA